MRTIKERGFLGLKLFSGSHIGLYHEFFDKLVGVQTQRGHNTQHMSRIIQNKLAFGQIQLQRLAFGARLHKGGIGSPQRF